MCDLLHTRTPFDGAMEALLLHGAKVYIAGRSPEKIQNAISDLQKETGKEALPLIIDLADLSSVRIGVEDFLRCEFSRFSPVAGS